MAALLPPIAGSAGETAAEFCPELYARGTLQAPFNVAFLHVQKFNTPDGGKSDGLLMSSFFNAVKDAEGRKVQAFSERDLVARLPDLNSVDFETFDGTRDIQILTDLDGVSRQVWPNESSRVPDGVLPFEAIISPQGFQSTPRAGRLTLINLDDPQLTEYVVHQSTYQPPRCEPGSQDNQPWFYHDVRWVDMDGDQRRDIVTVRSSFIVAGGFCAPTGQLVWFKNPGDAIAPDLSWEEFILVDKKPKPGGPEVNMNVHDFDGDGVPEVIASHFFKYDGITIYGAPKGAKWTDVDPENGVLARQKDIMRGQGNPFAVEIVDLNLDGRMDVLTSNHQGDQCFEVTSSEISGRVIAIEQPADGQIFDSDWSVHVIKDNIRATPTFPEPKRGPGRLAPNRAVPFWPMRALEDSTRPWIIVGGDEAAKVWILKPSHPLETDRWEYESSVIFDINEHYGAGTTQRLQTDPQGISISTIGGLAWRYDEPGPLGMAEFYLPVFEARDIHVFSFRPGAGKQPVSCSADVYPACPQ